METERSKTTETERTEETEVTPDDRQNTPESDPKVSKEDVKNAVDNA